MLSYLPQLHTRVHEILAAVWFLLFRQSDVGFCEGDCLVVCDPLEGYRTLFGPKEMAALRKVIRCAVSAKVPVVYTRWARFDTSRKDAVDNKGHWSAYLPSVSHARILSEVASTHATPDLLIDVAFPNAFAHTTLGAFCALRRTRRLVLAGGWAESCVHSTASAAVEMGMLPIVVTNATVGHFLCRFVALVQLQLFCGQACVV